MNDQNLKNLIEELIQEGILDQESTDLAELFYWDSETDQITTAKGNLQLSEATLDGYFKLMSAAQLKQVAKRFNPTAEVNRMDDCKKAIKKVLDSPKLLDNMIARFSELEREILIEAKRLGGQVDGWALIIFAAIQGFTPKSVQMNDVYKDFLARSKAVAFIATLLRDGLLLPRSNYAAWFVAYNYFVGERKSDDDLLSVDPRILARLPNKTKSVALQKLPLKKVPASLNAQHPVQILLELNETIHLIQEQDGLQVTKAGTASKTAVNRFVKARPWLESRIENILVIIMEMNLLQAPLEQSSPALWKVNLDYFHEFQLMPLVTRYTIFIESFLHSIDLNKGNYHWEDDSGELVSLPAACRALLESLILLPQYHVLLSDALAALWPMVLYHTVRKRYFYDDDDEEELKDMPTWFAKALIGAFKELGLVAVAKIDNKAKPSKTSGGSVKIGKIIDGKMVIVDPSEREIDESGYAIMPTLGYQWYQQSKELRFDKTTIAQSPDELKTTSPTDVINKIYELIESNSQASNTKDKALLIQANYEILVYLDKLSLLAIMALGCADCTGIEAQTATYKLSRTSIYRILETGLGIEKVLSLLEKNSSGLPNNVANSLREWSLRREKLSVYQDVLLARVCQ